MRRTSGSPPPPHPSAPYLGTHGHRTQRLPPLFHPRHRRRPAGDRADRPSRGLPGRGAQGGPPGVGVRDGGVTDAAARPEARIGASRTVAVGARMLGRIVCRGGRPDRQGHVDLLVLFDRDPERGGPRIRRGSGRARFVVGGDAGASRRSLGFMRTCARRPPSSTIRWGRREPGPRRLADPTQLPGRTLR